MQNIQALRELNQGRANQPTPLTPIFVQTNLNPLFHTVVSFHNDSTINPVSTPINPVSTPSNPIEHLSSNTVVAETPQPLGEPSDVGTQEENENLDDNSDDSDFMHDNGDEDSDSIEDDLSLDDVNGIKLDHKAVEKPM